MKIKRKGIFMSLSIAIFLVTLTPPIYAQSTNDATTNSQSYGKSSPIGTEKASSTNKLTSNSSNTSSESSSTSSSRTAVTFSNSENDIHQNEATTETSAVDESKHQNSNDLNSEFVNWSPATKTASAVDPFSRDSKQFRVDLYFPFLGRVNNALFGHAIFDSTGGKHTYSYKDGDSNTSFYNLNNNTHVQADEVNYYFKDGGNNNSQLARVITDRSNNVQISEILNVTATGAITHQVKWLNIGTAALSNQTLSVFLDTDLDGDDYIPIYSTGNNGAFIKTTNLTLYCEALSGVQVYAGQYEAGTLLDGVLASGDYGRQLTGGIDTAISYQSPNLTLNPGETYDMTYQERVFTPEEQLGHVTVHFVDQQGHKLVDDQSLNDAFGQSYTVVPKTISGYQIVRTEGETTGTYQNDGQNVTFIYGKAGNAAGNVMASFFDDQGHKLADDVVQNGDIGNKYTTTGKEVDGYYLKKIDGNPTGIFTKQAQTITYVYAKLPTFSTNNVGRIVIHYVNEHGNTIAPDRIHSDRIGIAFNVNPEVIDGYTFQTVAEKSLSGKYSNHDQEITLVYKQKVKVHQADTIKTNKAVNAKYNSSEKHKHADLPATNVAKFGILSSIGVVLGVFVVIGSLFWFRHRR
ncbi:MucBP domain-containing protein [Furfurilactobacillus sp. WILCCON 0119]